MNKIAVFSLDKEFKKVEKQITLITLKVLKILKKENIYVEIYLAGDKLMRQLNKKHRGKDKPTDVLSFSEPPNFILPPSKYKKIGEIYLNLEKTTNYKLQTTNYKLQTTNYLLIHGLLHLLGYNHKNKSDRIKMEQIERKLLNEI